MSILQVVAGVLVVVPTHAGPHPLAAGSGRRLQRAALTMPHACFNPTQVHARGKTIGKDVDYEKIARRTPGFTGGFGLEPCCHVAACAAAA